MARFRGVVGLRLLSIAFATGVISDACAQTATELPVAPPPAAAGATNGTAGGMTGEEAAGQAQTSGRPYGSSFSALIDLSQTYETNPLGLLGFGGPNTGADTFTALSLALGAHDHTERFTGDLQYMFVGDAYARYSAYDQIYNYLTALATATVVPDYFVIQGSAFAAPILVNGLGPLAAYGMPVAGGTNTGMWNTYGYSISPDLRFQLGNFARSDTILNNSAIFFVLPGGPTVSLPIPGQAPPAQLITYSATELFSSGSDFNRLKWRLTGNGSRTTSTGISFQVESGVADIEYAVTREIALVSTLGYESFTSTQTLTHAVSGPVELGGLRINLGSRFQADVRAGRQFNYPSYLGDVNYELTPFTGFVASLTDSVTTPAAAVLGSLGTLGTNDLGAFYNTNYQLGQTPPSTVSNVFAFTPAPIDGSAITDYIARYRAASASIFHTADRTQYRLTGFWTVYDTLTVTPGVPPRTTSTGAEFDLMRNINPKLTAGLVGSYAVQTILGGEYSILMGSVTLSYALTAVMQAYFRTGYVHRLSNAALVAASPLSGSVSDTAITIGIRRQF